MPCTAVRSKLRRMKYWLLLLLAGALSGGFFVGSQNGFAQILASEDAARSGVILSKLSPPVYPPLARQARIAGDVKVQVWVRADGSVDSAEVISGHPMLSWAALESAQRSQYQCHGCSQAATAYLLTYSFVLPAEGVTTPEGGTATSHGAAEFEAHPGPQVVQLQDHITITAGLVCLCVDPAYPGPFRRRSAKCLYLWRCSSHRL